MPPATTKHTRIPCDGSLPAGQEGFHTECLRGGKPIDRAGETQPLREMAIAVAPYKQAHARSGSTCITSVC